MNEYFKPIALIVMGIILMIIGLCGISHDAHADVLVDDFKDTQTLLSYKQEYVDSDEIPLLGSELYNATRTIMLYSGLLRENSSFVILAKGQVYIDNTIDKNQEFRGKVTLEYKFNNENFDNFTGIKVTVYNPKGNRGKITASINGPSGQSYAKFHKFNINNIVKLPFSEFKGSKLFNNINRLRIDFVDIDVSSDNVIIELVEK